MKLTKEQKEHNKLQRQLKRIKDSHHEHLKAHQEAERELLIQEFSNMLKSASNREELRVKLIEWLGGAHEFSDTILYKRFPLTKLEKALK